MFSEKNRDILAATLNTKQLVSLETVTVSLASTYQSRNKYKFFYNTLLSVCTLIAVFLTSSSSDYSECD